MNIDEVRSKHRMSVDNAMNIRAIYGGTLTITPDEH